MKVRSPESALLLILVLLTLGLRVVHIEADPPADFSWSGGYFADEGYWSHNARNRALFGSPVLDQWDARILSPLFAYIQQLLFSAFGVGLAQVRIIGILSSLLITIATFLILRRQFDLSISFLGSVFVSWNYPLLVLGRQGILDSFSAALACFAFVFVLKEKKFALLSAGIFLVLSFITKYLMVYLLLPFLIVSAGIFQKRISWIPVFIGMALPALLWLFFNFLPNCDLLLSYSRYYSSQQTWEIVPVMKNIVLQPFYLYFLKTGSLLFFGNLMLWFGISQFRSLNRVERIYCIWLAAGIVFFALWRYRPLRYYTSLIPPLAALSVFVLLRAEEIARSLRKRPDCFFVWPGLSIPFLQILFVLIDRWTGLELIPKELGIQTFDALLFLAISAVSLFVLLGVKEKRRWLFVVLVTGFILVDIKSYFVWHFRPDYSAVEIGRDLQSFAGGGVVSGQWAPEVCLENDLRVVPVWHGFVNSEDPIDRYGITHLLLWRYPLGDEAEKFSEWYPEDFQKFFPVKKYTIKDSELLLLERFDYTVSPEKSRK